MSLSTLRSGRGAPPAVRSQPHLVVERAPRRRHATSSLTAGWPGVATPCAGRRRTALECRARPKKVAFAWEYFTISELKTALADLNLPTTGTKQQLVARLQAQYPGQDGHKAAISEPTWTLEDLEAKTYADVSIAELKEQLKRRGARFTAPTKQELFERLKEVLAGPPSSREPMSDAEMADWMLSRGLLPQGSSEELSAMVEAGREAEAAARAPGGAAEALLSPAVDVSTLTVAELKERLRALSLSTLGNKPQLQARLKQATTVGNQAAQTYRDAPGGDRDASGSTEEIHAYLSGLSVEQCQAALEERGLSTEGSPQQLLGRLETALLFQETVESLPTSGADDLRFQIERMTISELKAELKERGVSVTGLRSELEDRLYDVILGAEDDELGGRLSDDDSGLDEFEALRGEEEEGDGAPERGGRGLLEGYNIASWRHMLLREDLPDVRVAVIAGGPSLEASVSINSARTLMDMLQTVPYPEQEDQLRAYMVQEGVLGEDEPTPMTGIWVDVYYIDRNLQAWLLPPSQLYSNSPEDFEFKLPSIAAAFESLEDMAEAIKQTADVAFPAVHGVFGEDGKLQEILEAAGVEFVGADALSCATAFNKRLSYHFFGERGYPVLNQEGLCISDFDGDELKEEPTKRLALWMSRFGMELEETTLVVKPVDGGSSLFVSVHEGLTAAVDAAKELFDHGVTTGVVIEPKVLGGLEFTVVVIGTKRGPLALMPSTIHAVDYADDIFEADRELERSRVLQAGEYPEVDELSQDKSDDSVFTFRRKYLPSTQVRTNTPPQLPVEIVQSIRRGAERAFLDLGLRDCARIDGWVIIDAQEHLLNLVSRYVEQHEEPTYLDPGMEDPTPGPDPVEAARPFSEGLSAEEVYAMGPTWREELGPPEEVKYIEKFDRYFSKSHFEQMDQLLDDETAKAVAEFESEHPWLAAAADAAAGQAELADGAAEQGGDEAQGQGDSGLGGWDDVQLPLPLDPVKVATGDLVRAEVPLVALPGHTLTMTPRELCDFGTGVVVFTDVNPTSGMEQNSFLFQQAAALGLSHAAVLRHLLSQALRRRGLRALPAAAPITVLQTEPVRMGDEDAAADGEGAAADDEDDVADDGEIAEAGVSEAEEEEDDGDVIEAFGEDDADDDESEYVEYGQEGEELSGVPPEETEEGRAAARDEIVLPRQRVYVLCGGNSSERQISLSSGVNAWLQLSRYPDLDVQLFLLAPQHAGIRERERRRELLQRRNEHLLLGIPEDKLPFEMSLYNIYRPADDMIDIEDRIVWEVPAALALKHSCEEVVEACETLLAFDNTVDIARSIDAKASRNLVLQALWEMRAAGVRGVGDSFEGVGGPSTQAMEFRVFANMARGRQAVVFNAVHGDIGENGELQAYLSEIDVRFTGPGSLACELCMDKVETARQLEPLSTHGIYIIPKLGFSAEELVELAAAPDRCTSTLENIREALGLEGGAVCIKPSSDGCSFGVARIDTENDLFTYATAVTEEWDFIPGDMLSEVGTSVEMPSEQPQSFIVEPFIVCDELEVGCDQDGNRQISHTANSGFVEVTIGLFGVAGGMHAMAPSLTVKSGAVLSLEEKFQSGAGINLTPPPEELVSAEATAAARERAELVAHALQLHGMSRIDAFMNIEDGSLFVIEVNTIPGLTPATALFHQALAEDPPIYPNEFLRMQVLIALSTPSADQQDGDDEGNVFGNGFMADDDYFDDQAPADGEAPRTYRQSAWSNPAEAGSVGVGL